MADDLSYDPISVLGGLLKKRRQEASSLPSYTPYLQPGQGTGEGQLDATANLDDETVKPEDSALPSPAPDAVMQAIGGGGDDTSDTTATPKTPSILDSPRIQAHSRAGDELLADVSRPTPLPKTPGFLRALGAGLVSGLGGRAGQAIAPYLLYGKSGVDTLAQNAQRAADLKRRSEVFKDVIDAQDKAAIQAQIAQDAHRITEGADADRAAQKQITDRTTFLKTPGASMEQAPARVPTQTIGGGGMLPPNVTPPFGGDYSSLGPAGAATTQALTPPALSTPSRPLTVPGSAMPGSNISMEPGYVEGNTTPEEKAMGVRRKVATPATLAALKAAAVEEPTPDVLKELDYPAFMKAGQIADALNKMYQRIMSKDGRTAAERYAQKYIEDNKLPNTIDNVRKAIYDYGTNKRGAAPPMNILMPTASGDSVVRSVGSGSVVPKNAIGAGVLNDPTKLDARDPAMIQSWVQQIKQNPDLYAGLNPAMRDAVSLELSKEGAITPTKAGETQRSQEIMLRTSLAHIAKIREIMADPRMQASIGPIMGNIGRIGQALGASLNRDPDAAQMEQDLRTRLQYLISQEARGAYPGRPAQQLINDLKTASARPGMELPMFLGALSGAEGSATINLDQIKGGRYGGSTSGKMPGAPATPAAAPSQVREQFSKSTNQYRYSTDGGQTWHPGRAPR